MHILKTIRSNWLNQKYDSKLFSYPDLNCISIDQCTNPLKIQFASFRDIHMLYYSENDSLAKLAPRFTLKSLYASDLELQNVKFVLKVVHESTIAALAIQNEQRSPAFKCHTSEFVQILSSVWKIFNVNVPGKHTRMNHPFSSLMTFNDELVKALASLYKLQTCMPCGNLISLIPAFMMFSLSYMRIVFILIMFSRVEVEQISYLKR